jgi:hypothetical protein
MSRAKEIVTLCSDLQSHLALLKFAGLCFLEALVTCRDIHLLYLLSHLVGMHTPVAKSLQTWKGVCYVHAMWACTDPICVISTLLASHCCCISSKV